MIFYDMNLSNRLEILSLIILKALFLSLLECLKIVKSVSICLFSK